MECTATRQTVQADRNSLPGWVNYRCDKRTAKLFDGPCPWEEERDWLLFCVQDLLDEVGESDDSPDYGELLELCETDAPIAPLQDWPSVADRILTLAWRRSEDGRYTRRTCERISEVLDRHACEVA